MKASTQPGDDHVYSPTSGTVSGWIGLAIAAIFVIGVLAEDRSLNGARYALGALIFGLLVWCYMLRPRVVIGGSVLELRNALSSWHIPLVDVRSVSVRAVMLVTTDQRRYDGVALGRPARSLLRGGQERVRFMATPGGTIRVPNEPASLRQKRDRLDANAQADLAVEQILFGADQARERGETSRPATRTWSVPALAGFAVLMAALAVTLAV